MLANKIFKGLKTSFEGIKDIIKNVEERQIYAQDINDLNKQMLAKMQKSNSERMRFLHQHKMNNDHLKQKHMADMADLQEEEDSILQKEVPDMTADIAVLQNQLLVTEQRHTNIRTERDNCLRAKGDYINMGGSVKSL